MKVLLGGLAQTEQNESLCKTPYAVGSLNMIQVC